MSLIKNILFITKWIPIISAILSNTVILPNESNFLCHHLFDSLDYTFVSPELTNRDKYDQYAVNYDDIDGNPIVTSSLGIDKLRFMAGKLAVGHVFEVAMGTGLQIPYYDWNRIETYKGVDISSAMLSIAQNRIDGVGKHSTLSSKIKLEVMDATDLKEDEDKYDTVIDTFSLCVIKDPVRSLQEMKRIVKPTTGRIILLENTKSSNTILGSIQDLFEPIITPISKGCKWNVNVRELANRIGLKEEKDLYRDTQLGTLSLSVYIKPKE